MQIKRIRLRGYRNYDTLTLTPAEGLNVLLGDNAAGKTNVLEALFLCALGRSHRTRRDVELIKQDKDFAGVDVELEKRTGAHSISCRLLREGRREMKIDGKPLSRSGELLGCLHVVMFSPEDLRLIKQGPVERRRFVDMELSQLQPRYYYLLQQYNAALKQRNALLKDAAATDRLHAPWEEQLATLGAEIQQKRQEFLLPLGETARQLHAELTDGKEALSIAYQPTLDLSVEPDAREALLSAIAGCRARDVLRGSTSVGPHRDDLLITLDGVDVRAFGSQGQQRTAALSLKLSELSLLKALEQEAPVLLLDDVLSELDGSRQRLLVNAIEGCQTFLTCTQLAGLKNAGAGAMRIYRINAGCVTPDENGNTGEEGKTLGFPTPEEVRL